MRKYVLISSFIIFSILLIILFSFISRDRMLSRIIDNVVKNNQEDMSYLEDMDEMKVLFYGNRSTPENINRAGTVVIVDDNILLFDPGEGTIAAMNDDRFPISLITAVFITTPEYEHFCDLPKLLQNRSLKLKEQSALQIYGPTLMKNFLPSAIELSTPNYKHNEETAQSHQYPDFIKVHTIQEEQASYNLTGKNGLVVIHAIPYDDSFGQKNCVYRIDYRGKSVLIAGNRLMDAKNILPVVKNVDLLIHEAYLPQMYDKTKEIYAENESVEKMSYLNNYFNSHSSIEDLSQLAQSLNVDRLLVNNMVPYPSNLVLRRFYMAAIRRHFSGDVDLAKEGKPYKIELNEQN